MFCMFLFMLSYEENIITTSYTAKKAQAYKKIKNIITFIFDVIFIVYYIKNKTVFF